MQLARPLQPQSAESRRFEDTMSTAKFVEVHVGDVVRLRKAHPCGGTDWSVVRLGADIGLRCALCGHRIMLARSLFERRLKTFLSRAILPDPAAGPE